MKKLAQLRGFLRQIIERFATFILGILCLALVFHYWSDAGNNQVKSAAPSKMLIVMKGEKLIVVKKAPLIRMSVMERLGLA